MGLHILAINYSESLYLESLQLGFVEELSFCANNCCLGNEDESEEEQRDSCLVENLPILTKHLLDQ